jgi:hypothetical protein
MVHATFAAIPLIRSDALMTSNPLKKYAAFLFLSVLALSTALPTLAQDHCNAALIEALKTRYSLKDNLTVAESVYQAACENHGDKTGISGYGVSIGNESVSTACSQNDRRFFERYERDLSCSFIPQEGWKAVRDICGKNPVQLTVEQTGKSIQVSASFIGNNATVKSFTYTSNSVSCPAHAIRRGVILHQGTTPEICTRISDDEAIFAITTDQGGQFAALDAITPQPYTLSIGWVDDRLECYLNGGLIGARNIQQNGTPMTPIILNLIPGRNIFQCKIIDLANCPDGQHCWSYTYTVTHGDKLISQMSDLAHGVYPERQPAPLIIDYEPEGSPKPAHKGSSKTAKPPDKTP